MGFYYFTVLLSIMSKSYTFFIKVVPLISTMNIFVSYGKEKVTHLLLLGVLLGTMVHKQYRGLKYLFRFSTKLVYKFISQHEPCMGTILHIPKYFLMCMVCLFWVKHISLFSYLQFF
jgi:hypothetical protein